MLQGYFLARDHIYICDKFAHGLKEKEDVYLRGYVSRLVCDKMAVAFLETCSQEAGWMLGHTLGFSHPQHLVPACHHALPCIQCLHSLHGRSNLHIRNSDPGILAVTARSWSKNRSLTSSLRPLFGAYTDRKINPCWPTISFTKMILLETLCTSKTFSIHSSATNTRTPAVPLLVLDQ